MPLTNKSAVMWANLEQFISPETVMAVWQAVFGADFTNTQPFLWSNGELADEYPCTNHPPCGCDHEVIAHAPDRIVAACRCDPPECKTIPLQPKDVLIYALDSRKFCRAIRAAFEFDTPPDERAILHGAPYTWSVGMYGALHSPVYLIIRQSEHEFLKEIEGLITGQTDPFILLAPTQRHLTPTVQAILQRQKAVFIPLSRTLSLDGLGQFKMISPIQPILDHFAHGLAEGKGLVKTVEKFGRDIEAVAKGNYELRKENEELRRLHAEGYFKFAQRVDAEDFQALATIMALKTRKAAADFLEIPFRTFYDRVEKWTTRGHSYQLMFRWVEWRKNTARQINVPIVDSLLSGEPNDRPENPKTIRDVLTKIKERDVDNKEYPDILRQILGAMIEQNAGNWPSVRAEIIGIITAEIPQ